MGFFSRYRNYRNNCRAEFMGHVGELLDMELIRALDTVPQHFRYTRLRHSMDVAYITFFIARVMRFDSRSAARAGVLHDLFFYEEGQKSRNLLRAHPQIALDNAREICPDLNEIEADAILRHMWMLTAKPPRYKEGMLLTFVDKYCATREFVASLFASGRVTYMSEQVREVLLINAEQALDYLADQEDLAEQEAVAAAAVVAVPTSSGGAS